MSRLDHLLHGPMQPLLQKGQVKLAHVAERKSYSEIRLRIHDRGLGFKVVRSGEDLHEHTRSARKGLRHIQVASIQAQFRYAGEHPGAGIDFRDFCAGDKGKPGGPPPVDCRTICFGR